MNTHAGISLFIVKTPYKKTKMPTKEAGISHAVYKPSTKVDFISNNHSYKSSDSSWKLFTKHTT